MQIQGELLRRRWNASIAANSISGHRRQDNAAVRIIHHFASDLTAAIQTIQPEYYKSSEHIADPLRALNGFASKTEREERSAWQARGFKFTKTDGGCSAVLHDQIRKIQNAIAEYVPGCVLMDFCVLESNEIGFPAFVLFTGRLRSLNNDQIADVYTMNGGISRWIQSHFGLDELSLETISKLIQTHGDDDPESDG